MIPLLLFTIVGCIPQQTGASSHYNPEIQGEGIPVISSRSVVPAVGWTYENDDFERSQSAPIRRRSSDVEFEDDEEDERDEHPSGSSNHDSYENPAFGESRRAAKDGDDIENFFDKHLGPQESDHTQGDENDAHLNSYISPRVDHDSDDHYEAAGSSPLATIFHSLLNIHKRPLVIHTAGTGSGDEASTPSQSSSASDQHHQQLASSTSAISTSLRGTGAYLDATPIAFFTPIAATSSLAAYEPAASALQSSELVDQAITGQGDGNSVREIYLTRRPSLFNHFQTYSSPYSPSAQSKLLHQSSSNAYWRDSPISSGSQSYDTQSDYSRYPFAASTSAYAPSSASSPSQQSSSDDDDQTVSYNLSFGRRPPVDNGADNEANSDANAADNTEPAYNNNRPSSSMMMRQQSPSRSYSNNYHSAPAVVYTANGVGGQHGANMMRLQSQQSPYNGAQYHKDPSELVASQPYR